MAHDHQHGGGTGHTSTRNISIVFWMNLLFSVLEFLFGVLFNSRAILADAVHDLGDAISMALAYLFQKISERKADDAYTFGYHRFSLLGALITGVVLIGGSILMIINSVPRLLAPEPIVARGVFWLALVAIAMNGYSAWILSKGTSRNESMLNIHILEDVLGWIAVLIMGVVVHYTELYFLDPLLSIAIALYILIRTIPEFWRTLKILLENSPEEVDVEQFRDKVLQVPGVARLTHLHLWSLDGEENALTVTVLVDKADLRTIQEVKAGIRALAKEAHVEEHAHIEIVFDASEIDKPE